MIKKSYQQIYGYFRQINWKLLLFLLLVMNVKLVVKVLALLLILALNHRDISFKNIRQQKLVFFYLTMIGIAIINFFLQLKSVSLNYDFALSLGLLLWLMAALAGFFIYYIIQRERPDRLIKTIGLFSLLHIATVFFNLLIIVIETGALNPYTYTGLNQRYFISTGDHISGITFDSPVATAAISAFAVIFFLYQHRFFFSLAAMASLLLIGSNLTNLFFIAVAALSFLFYTDRIQKSLTIIYACMLLVFTVKISPQNNEYVGRFAYKLFGMTYDLPKKNETLKFIKSQPDSLLDYEERRKKIAALYVDSVKATKISKIYIDPEVMRNNLLIQHIKAGRDSGKRANKKFYEYKPSHEVADQIKEYKQFLRNEYPADSSLLKPYDWKKPGKWIAIQQLLHFFKDHPGSIPTGTGLANFSSRTAFKASSLGMAGSYPHRLQYIHPWFRDNHLFTYVFYHSQSQSKHSAENIPDSTYNQVLGEYGLAGVLAFITLYLGYFIRHRRYIKFGWPILVLLLLLFLVEYWFEQLSIVILAETLLFLDIRLNQKPGKEGIPA